MTEVYWHRLHPSISSY